MNPEQKKSRTTCLVNPRAANNKWIRNKKIGRYLEKKFPGSCHDLLGDRLDTIRITKESCDHSDMIVAIGGDGTIADVLQGIFEAGKEDDVVFGIVPFGSGNGFRESYKIPKNPKKAIDALIRGKVVKSDIIEVEGRYAGFASVGAAAGVTQEKLRHEVHGLFGHLLATWRIFKMPRDMKTVILYDGIDDQGRPFEEKTLETSFFDCIVAKTGFFGYSWRIAPQADIEDGYLDVTLLEIGPVHFILAFPLIYFGHFQRTQKHFKAKKVVIKGKSLPVQYNGEILGELDEVTFNVRPHALKIIVGR